jgi:hypothetical protein
LLACRINGDARGRRSHGEEVLDVLSVHRAHPDARDRPLDAVVRHVVVAALPRRVEDADVADRAAFDRRFHDGLHLATERKRLHERVELALGVIGLDRQPVADEALRKSVQRDFVQGDRTLDFAVGICDLRFDAMGCRRGVR